MELVILCVSTRTDCAVDARSTHLALGVSRPLCFPIDVTMERVNYGRLGPLLAALLLVCLFPFSPSAEDRQPTIRFVRNPDPAPEFSLPSLDGKPLTLAGS